MEKEKIGLLIENESLKQQLAELKLQSGQVLHSLNETHNLKTKLENYAQRFERLCRYQTSTVEELLQENEHTNDCKQILPRQLHLRWQTRPAQSRIHPKQTA